MPKHIILIEPQYGAYAFNYVPQGLLSIAAMLESSGHKVSIYNSGPIPSCDIIGVSATISQYDQALSILRNSDAGVVVVGGAFPTTSPVEAVSSTLIDVVVIGDGEDAILKIASGKDKRNIPGVVYTDRCGAVVINPYVRPKYSFRDNRQLLPAYHLLQNIGKHINVTRNREYTWNWSWRRKNRPKYWEDFTSEISSIKNLGVEFVTVTDEHFGDWHDNIRSTISALDMLSGWLCRTTTDVVIKRSLDTKLKDSRCISVELDIVSASKRMLAELGNVTVEDHNTAYKLLKDIGIEVVVHATLGLPGETIDSMMETWNWLSGKKVRLSTFVPMPGTDYYESHDNYSQFGFDIIGTNRCDFVISDTAPLRYLPWSSNTINTGKFIEARNKMIKELGHE